MERAFSVGVKSMFLGRLHRAQNGCPFYTLPPVCFIPTLSPCGPAELCGWLALASLCSVVQGGSVSCDSLAFKARGGLFPKCFILLLLCILSCKPLLLLGTLTSQTPRESSSFTHLLLHRCVEPWLCRATSYCFIRVTSVRPLPPRLHLSG